MKIFVVLLEEIKAELPPALREELEIAMQKARETHAKEEKKRRETHELKCETHEIKCETHEIKNAEIEPKTAISAENSGKNYALGGERGGSFLTNNNVHTDSTLMQDTLLSNKENVKEKNVTKKEKKSCENHKTELEKCRDAFWEIWPKHFRKTDKAGTLKALDKAFRENKDLSMDKILKAVEWWKNSDQWKKDNGQYIPEPKVWLNKRKWEVLENIPHCENTPVPIANNAPSKAFERGYVDPKKFAEKFKKKIAEAK